MTRTAGTSARRAPDRAWWLFKTEPDEFSIDALERCGVEPWGGVRNYQARNFLRDQTRVGDGVMVYHSSCEAPGIVGIATIASTARPDPTQFDPASDYHDPKSRRDAPRWVLVDIAFERKLARPIALAQIRAHSAALDGLALIARGNRLSIMPIAPHHAALILALEMSDA